MQGLAPFLYLTFLLYQNFLIFSNEGFFKPGKSFFVVIGLGAVVIHVGLSHPQTRFYPLFLATLDPGSGKVGVI